MNEKSAIPTEVRPTLALSRRQVNDWFVTNNGKEFSPFEKPLDTQKHCEERKAWVVKYYGLLTCPLTPVCYIDEKWFYTTNRRRKIKKLPRGPHEPIGADKVFTQKMISRRYPVKCMFMGVVGRPLPYRKFNGRIYLQRISKEKYIEKCTAHSNFSEDALINDSIKNGSWRTLLTDDTLAVHEIRRTISEYYGLEDEIRDRLEFFLHDKGRREWEQEDSSTRRRRCNQRKIY